MLPFGPISPVPPIDPSGAASFSTLPPADAPLADQRVAMSSQAGITVRLLASLPANLGQNLDAAV